MIPTTVDDVVQGVLAILQGSVSRPSSIEDSSRILDNDILPYETNELPVLGVYLAEDRLSDSMDMGGMEERVATVRIEIRAIGPMLSSTRDIRTWAKTVLLQNQFLGGIAKSITLSSFQPFGMPSNVRLAGADLDFDITYYSQTEMIYG